MKSFLNEEFGISDKVYELFCDVEPTLQETFENIKKNAEYNQYKVISAFRKNMVSESCFYGSTGYGYGDRGRDSLDKIYADIFHAEDALVRHQIVSGTQAIALCMYGVLRPGDELLAATGKPYDTLEEVIGIRGENNCGSLKDFGVTYKQVDLLEDGSIDYDGLKRAVNDRTKMVILQRSRGYSFRKSFTVNELGKAIGFIKNINPDIVVMVDNCYGEFVDTVEPTDVGADLIAGSLIKNPGGGIAQTGGYIAGRKSLVELCAYRLTTPGLGKEVGASQENNRLMYQGIFLSPNVVGESLKGAVLCAGIMDKLGIETSPKAGDFRSDIIQAVKFNREDLLISFCQGIQSGSPVDSFVKPEPWDMPGYDSKVIMAAGAFVAGSSIELSADGPCIPPYIAYMQGGLTYSHVKLGLMIAIDLMYKNGTIIL